MEEAAQAASVQNTSDTDQHFAENVDEISHDLQECDTEINNGNESKIDNNCFFCDKIRKKVKGREENLYLFTKVGRDSVKEIAKSTEDTDMVKKLNDLPSDVDSFYHKSCKVTYNNSRQLILRSNKEKTDWHFARDVRAEAYEVVENFVLQNIINQDQTFFLKFLNDLFIDHLKQQAGDISAYTLKPYHLQDRLLKKFPKKISIIHFDNKILVKPYKGIVLSSEIEKHNILEAAAEILNEKIRQLEHDKLPHNIKIKDLMQGECIVPQFLTQFYEKVLSGVSYRRRHHQRTVRLAKSYAEDLIYGVTNGRIKCSKHICLGMTVKSLTNSKKIVNVINRYGHCCSYSVLEGLETEATFSSCETSDICPDGIVREPGLHTGVAYDNYDRFVDTTSGKDTLHDTVGIIFQDVSAIESEEAVDKEDNDANMSNIEDDENAPKNTKHRRSFDVISHDLQPYTKRPRIVESLLPLDSPLRLETANLTSQRHVSFSWMISHYFRLPLTPMWVGYNSLVHDDTSPQQIVRYLTTINSSPTNKAVVLETMQQSKKVAAECGEDYMQVTYDLAIAKIALQIQSTEKGTFDNLFIHLGSFHIKLGYFKALGKFIDNCGIANIMVDAEMLASGSVSGVIAGKHFNRCKRLHPMVALAFKILHFESFIIEENITFSDELQSTLKLALIQFSKKKIIYTFARK